MESPSLILNKIRLRTLLQTRRCLCNPTGTAKTSHAAESFTKGSESGDATSTGHWFKRVAMGVYWRLEAICNNSGTAIRFSFLSLLVIALLFFADARAGVGDSVFVDGFEAPTQLIHRWTFSEDLDSGLGLLDDVGGANGQIIDLGNWYAFTGFGRLTVFGSREGGSQAVSDYAVLPAGVLSGLDEATIEIWARHDAVNDSGIIFDIGTGTDNSLSMTWDLDGEASSDRMEWVGASTHRLDGAMAPYVLGTEYQIVVVISRPEGEAGSLVRLFKDGVFQGERYVDQTLAEIASGEFLLARSRQEGRPTASCSYNEIRIYNGALSDEQVSQRFSEGPVDDLAINAIEMVESIEAYPFNKRQIEHTVTSTAGPIDQGVSWSTSNGAVATISFDGVLLAKQEGSAVITARSWADRSVTASTTVTVHPPTLKHLWTFSETGGPGTVLMDSVGQRQGQLVQLGSGDSSVGSGRVSLSGGNRSDADYIDLGNDLTHGVTDFTIEMWASVNSVNAWSRIFDFGPSASDTLFMSWSQFADPNTDRFEMRRNGETAFTVNDSMAPYAFGVDQHIVITVIEDANQLDETGIQWFLNGVFRGGIAVEEKWSDLQDTNNWLGRSKFPDPTAHASYDEFRIYHGRLTYEQIQDSYAAGPIGGGAVYGVEISGPNTVVEEESIELSATVHSSVGTISQDVTWSSNDENIAIVYDNGIVFGRAPGVATITATSQAVPSASRIHTVNVTPAPPRSTDAMLYNGDEDHFIWFKDDRYTVQVWAQQFPELSGFTQADWQAQWGSDRIDAAFYDPVEEKVYMFQSNRIARYSSDGVVDAGYPMLIEEGLPEWPEEWGFGDVDAAVYYPGNDKLYLFKGDEYSRATRGASVDTGYPKPIQGNWIGWPSAWGDGDVDSVTYFPGTGRFYLFKGTEYVRHSFTQAIDVGYPRPFSQWTNDAPQTATDLQGDFVRLKTDWTTQQWDGTGFPDSWADSRGLDGHIQGVAKIANGQWVMSHNREGDPGFLIAGNNDDFYFYTWNDWGYHPGSIQAAGNVVAVPFNGSPDDQEVRFVHFGRSGPVELSHLRVEDTDVGLPNSVGIAFYPPHDAYYMIIGVTTNRTQVKNYPLYKSHAGKSLLDDSNQFERIGQVSVEGSETGMQLMFDEATGEMYLLTLYRGDGDGLLVPNRHRAVLSLLTFPTTVDDEGPYSGYTFSGDVMEARQDFDVSGGIFTDPSFRFGAGAVLDGSGRLNLIATERCIPPIYFWMQSCQGDGIGIDYFILKP